MGQALIGETNPIAAEQRYMVRRLNQQGWSE